ncbi:hypothetical protein GCM10022415_03040 [Knoellia locipacati]|uniref:Putative Flp pilus-assembly TadG-like N-terminal domain-containing protein n=1 Tax=Knoellia locipacati TaxID=882824 RepID=A0A512SWC6_9MICO|nr:pilus assembly protein TadG-related protein [Knoellia locipacati]GEQ12256.1 hypothetical protein KLO01_03030 [Knoellia locipacati]
MTSEKLTVRRRDERGAVGALVGLLFGAFVVTGLLAWSADVGQVMWERRQTQNAADAAALALAQSCAKNNCVAGADNLPALVNANTVNNALRTHTLERQCKRNTSIGSLPQCTSTPSITALRECPPMPSTLSTLPYVEVRVGANEGGLGIIPNPFSRVNNSPADDSTQQVYSCSRAAWGVPAANSFLAPIAISTCEWRTYSAGGTTYHPAPTGAWPGYGGAGQPPWPLGPTNPNTAGREVVITLHGSGDSSCPSGPSGGDVPGGFGYLDSTGSCNVTTSTTNGTDYWAPVSTGSSAPNSCRSVLADVRDNGPVIDLPVYDCIVNNGSGAVTPSTSCLSGNGSSARYHLAGVARFYLSGYKITGSESRPSRVTGSVPCSGSARCISGWFVSGVLSNPTGGVVAPTPSNPGFGLSVVVPAG